jgi:hypothetical protein
MIQCPDKWARVNNGTIERQIGDYQLYVSTGAGEFAWRAYRNKAAHDNFAPFSQGSVDTLMGAVLQAQTAVSADLQNIASRI